MHSFNLQLYSASVLFHALIISLLLWRVLCCVHADYNTYTRVNSFVITKNLYISMNICSHVYLFIG